MDLFARMGCDGLLEESQEVGPVAGGCALAEDLAGADVQGGEQVRGAVAAVVMGAFLSHVELRGRPGLGARQGLDLGLFVETAHAGSLLTLKVPCRWGFNPFSRHIDSTNGWAAYTPSLRMMNAAISLLDQ